MSGYCPDCGNTLCICDEVKMDEGYIGDEDHYLIECDNCGQEFTTREKHNMFCSRACYLTAKADYERDQEK